ncbi:MAG TPA: hypothetical protein VN736_23850 [Candidatus Limnocylindrales bacterium]|nr:hypothetical protein [Candidatus Limnocylindrales bacterium]
MKFPILLPLVICVVGLAGCSHAPAAGGSKATVTMRDGRMLTGTVQSSSATEIQLAGADGVTQTIPMTQVRSIDYGDSGSTVSSAPPAQSSPDAPPVAAPDPVHDNHVHPDTAAVTTKTSVIPAGAQVSVRTEETIDSGHAVEGQTFAAEIARDVRDAAGDCVIPKGSNAQLVIRSASKGGHFRGASDLVIDLGSVSIDGQRYRLRTTDVVAKGHDGVGANKRTAEFAGGGAAVGAIIGAIAGHGKGAAIGAASGGGGGALTEALTKGHVKVPVESVLTFRLEAPLTVEAVR